MSEFSFSINSQNHPKTPPLRELFNLATSNWLSPERFAHEVVQWTWIIATVVITEWTGAIMFRTHSRRELPWDIIDRIDETKKAIEAIVVPA